MTPLYDSWRKNGVRMEYKVYSILYLYSILYESTEVYFWCTFWCTLGFTFGVTF